MVRQNLIRDLASRATTHFWVALIFSAWLSSAHACRAQEPEAESPIAAPKPVSSKPDGTKALPNILNEGTLDTTARLYLDDNGKPILVPSESLGTFLKNRKEFDPQRSDQIQAPSFVMDETNVEIAVEGSQAKLTGTFKATLSSSAPNVVTIPLRFDSCQIVEAPQFVGEGESLLEVRGGSAGYQWYLKAAPSTKHTAILKGGVAVVQQGDRNQLRLNMPLAPTSYAVRLPADALDATVRGQGNEVVDTDSLPGAVVLQIRGSGGELTISWRSASPSSRLSAVEASSITRVQIDEPRQPWKASTEVTLRWFGSDANDSVFLALPPGARWLQTPASLSERYLISNAAEQAKPESAAAATVEKPVEQVLAADPTPADSAKPEAQRLTIRNLEPSLMQPIDLRLEWEWEPSSQGDEAAGQSMQVPSMTIEGADSHTGTVEFLIPTGYAPTWKEQPGTQLVQQAPPIDAFDRSQYLFRFSRQPLQLTASFQRPSKAAPIRPTYLAHFDGYKIKLTAWLDCTFDPVQPAAISMSTADWIIESAEVADMTAPHVPGEALSLQPQADGSTLISPAAPESAELSEQRRGRQVWRVIAYRPWEPQDENAFSFQLPLLHQPRTDGSEPGFDHGTGILIVTSSDNLLLKNQPGKTKGLLVDSLVPQWQPLLTTGAAKKTLVYRFQSRGEVPLWAGTAEPLPQQIVLEQRAELSVNANQVQISQDFELQIANEPLSPLRLAIREDALRYLEPQLTIDGVPFQLKPVNALNQAMGGPTREGKPALDEDFPSRDAAEINEADDAAQLPTVSESSPEVELAAEAHPQTATQPARKDTWRIFEPVSSTPLLGAVTVSVRTAIPWTANSELHLSQIAVPLVQIIVPRETRLREQNWSLKPDRVVEVFETERENTEVDPEGTEQALSVKSRLIAAGAEPRDLVFGQTEVILNARKLESLTYLPVRIGRSWLQTIVNGNERRDRYSAQIESALPRLSIHIPASRNLNYVIVDGKRVTDSLSVVFTDQGTQFQIDLPNGGDGRQHHLEVWMSSSEALTWLTPLDIDIPQIEGAQYYDRFYWQLAVPSAQHIGFASAQMTPEWVWKWNGVWWNRESRLKQADLERWVGATQQTEMPLSVNSYVLSSFGGGRPFQIWVLSRFVMWLPIGLAAIGLSVLLVSFRALRHPAWLLLTAGGIATAAMLAPDLAVLLGQTALLSLGLVSLILITQAAIESRVRRRSVFTVRPSHYTERSDHFSLARNVKIASPSSTRAHSAVITDGDK